MLLLFVCFSSALKPVQNHGWLHVENKYIKDENNQIVTLRGVALPFHSDLPDYYKHSVITQAVNKLHASVIRATIVVEWEGGYLDRKNDTLNLIDNAVKEAVNEGVYIY